MKFNIGDKVRLTRKWILFHLRHINTTEEDWLELAKRLINWFEICQRDIGLVYADENGYYVKEEHLELVEDEFSLGQQVEVSDDWENREKAFYIKILEIASDYRYIVAYPRRWEYGESDRIAFDNMKYIRKVKDKLTRKEIAEEFGVDEDFILTD